MSGLSVDQVLTGSELGFSSGLDDFLVLDMGATSVLYALNRAENRLVEIAVSSTGGLGVSGGLTLAGTVPAGATFDMSHAATANGDAFLAISGVSPADGQRVSISATGSLVAQLALPAAGALINPVGVAVAGVPILVTGTVGGGLAQFADTGSGFAFVSTFSDATDRALADVADTASYEIAGVTYVVSLSQAEQGLNVVSVGSSGLTQVASLGALSGWPVSLPNDVEVIARLDETLLLVASKGTSSLSALTIDANGIPRLADHIYDNDTTRFQAASQVSTVTYGDIVYTVAGGAEGGLSLFTVLPGGRLVHLDSIADDETAPLDQITALDATIADGVLQVFAGSGNEVGLTRLTYDLSQQGDLVFAAPDGSGAAGTQLDDQVIGSVVGEVLSGQAGDDILFDGRGNDTLTGGSGADLFVMTADGQSDQITDFERGVDRLDLSGFDFLYSLSQLTITPLANGATLDFFDETTFVFSADGQALTADDFSMHSVLNVDRPPMLQAGQEIIGTSADESLNGGAGADTIAGAGGADFIRGAAGLDLLLGGAGADTIEGQGERDTLVGGLGDDVLFGGDGNDVIYGDEWA